MWAVLERRKWILPSALVLTVTLVYLPSLAGGFLNYDDPWLIEHNAGYRDASMAAMRRFFFDWSYETRLSLGAEWLPLRDLSLWLDFRLVGPNPRALRLTQLGAYVAACLAFRGALRRTIPSARVAEAAAWVFALHPIHAESVAWLAGRKDVLALALVGAALYAYASPSRRVVWTAPILLGFAHLSKSMTVSAVGLLVAQDLIAGRRPRWAVIGVSLGVALAAFGAHAYVGRLVGMTVPPHGGDRAAALLIMGAVWLRYLALLALPMGLSVAHDVPSPGAVQGLLGWLSVMAGGALALYFWRRWRRGWPLGSWLWLVVPLVPVSQILFPLQNVMADRYLFLSAMSPALILATLCASRPGMVMLVALGFAALTQARAHLFADSVALFRDATAKTHSTPIAPYQLGVALEQVGDEAGAIDAHAEALRRERRSAVPGELGRRATNNQAKLLARGGQLDRAEAVLRAGRTRWPDDPKMLDNLAQVWARQGRTAEAERAFAELKERFPAFRRGGAASPGP